MVYTGDALDFSIKIHAGIIRCGGSFQVFISAQFGEHLAFDAPLLTAGCYPARLKAAAIRVKLQPDILLLIAAQLLRQFPHHTLACAARARGHVLSAAVIAQSALQLLFVFFHATAGIEL